MRLLPSVAGLVADRGVAFPNAYATTPLCCPSRASLLTGMYMHNHGVESNGDHAATQVVDSLTIAHTLQDAGYLTGMFGKYFNGWPNDEAPSGWDHWAITPSVTYGPADWSVDGVTTPVHIYPTTFIRKQSLGFLDSTEKRDRRPWFMYVTPMAPHMPATPEVRYAELPIARFHQNPAMLESNLSDKPPYVQDGRRAGAGIWNGRHVRQLRALASVDDLVARVIRRLRANGELGNTLIVFASDNGITWGEHGLGGKSTPYLPSVRVPLFIRWDHHIDPSSSDRRLVALLDLAPTILRATGTPRSHKMDGINLMRPHAERSALLLEFHTIGKRVPTWSGLVTTTPFEYVEYLDDTGSISFREYYDLIRDPWERKNLLGNPSRFDDPDVTAISAQLAALETCAGSRCVV